MVTIILAHGGSCWKRVVPLLRAAGYEPYTPTITGLGERIHLAHSGIDLDTHVHIVGIFEYEDLNRVELSAGSWQAQHWKRPPTR